MRWATRWARLPRLVQSAVALMVSTTATAVLGIVFWACAARLFTTSAVGRGSAEIASMMVIAQLAQLNLANAFLRFLPGAGARTRAFVLCGYAACASVAVVVATVFLATPLSAGVVRGGPAFAVLYVVAVALWTIFVVQDGVLTALRRARWVPVENIVFAVGKLLLLPLLVVTAPMHGVFLAWSLPVVLAVAVVTAYLLLRVVPARREVAAPRAPDRVLPGLRRVTSFFAAGYLTSIVSVASAYLLPVIVIKELGSKANAYFYVPWMLGIGFHNLLLNISSSFIVEASHEEDPFGELFWRTVRWMAGVTVCALGATMVIGPVALHVLSGAYAREGTSLLRWIGASFPFTFVTTLFTASLWMRRRVWAIFGYQLAQTVILVGLSYVLLERLGIDAPGVANLVAVGVVGVLSLPALVGWYRHSIVATQRPAPAAIGIPPATG